MAYLVRMMRGVFYGQLSELGHHAHDAKALVARAPLLIMIFSSIMFGLLPGRLLDVIRSGVNPILARLMELATGVCQHGRGHHQCPSTSPRVSAGACRCPQRSSVRR